MTLINTELPVFLKTFEPELSIAQPELDMDCFMDREYQRSCRLSLYANQLWFKIMRLQDEDQRADQYKIHFDFDIKFTLLRQPIPTGQAKLGEPYGLKFERHPVDGALQVYSNNTEKLLLFRERLSKSLNQRGFHQLYKPFRKIGKGNSATVYLAERLQDGKKIAVKAFAKEALSVQAKGRQALLNEITIMRQLNHPNLMKLYEVFETENSFYLAIQHLEGGQLFEKLNNRRFNNQEIKIILRNLINGLLYMHERRIIHRDLKPQNLIFRTIGLQDIVIADFGLATRADQVEYIFVRCGTPGYVAPEIINCRGKNGQQPISDVFSLGIIAHILGTGRSPFPGKEYHVVLQENRICNFNFGLQIYKSVDPLLLDLFMKMMEVSPDKRIKTNELLDHPFFKQEIIVITSKNNLEEDQSNGCFVALIKDTNNKGKERKKLQDSIGSFTVAKPNMIKGTNDEYNSMNSVNSSVSVPMSPQSIKVSKFTKRDRQVTEESQFKQKAEQPRKRVNISPPINLGALKEADRSQKQQKKIPIITKPQTVKSVTQEEKEAKQQEKQDKKD